MRLAKIAKLVSKAGLCDVYGDEYGTGVYISVGKAIYLMCRICRCPAPGIR